jgi:hypothetical protein
MDDRGSIPGRSRNLFCWPPCSDRSGAHSAQYPMGLGALCPGGKVARAGN